MSGNQRWRAALAVGLAAALACGSAASAASKPKPKPVKVGPNLLPNPGFEQSAIEGNPAVAAGSQSQPLLPTGWVFEGATVLFDHSQNVHHTGKRAAAISGSLSGGSDLCEAGPGQCVANPTNPAKSALAPAYTLAPHWRTQASVPVTAGRSYLLRFWGSWTTESKGQGLDIGIRWVGSNGVPLSEQTVMQVTGRQDQAWLPYSHTVKVPAGATGAVVLFGAIDAVSIGQVVYDDVFFATYG